MPRYFQDEEPTTQDILDQVKYLTETWQRFYDKNTTVERQLKGDFAIWDNPKDVEERPNYHPGTAREKVDDAVNLMVAYEPQIDVAVGGGDEEAQVHKNKANIKENMAARVWEEAGKEEPVHPAKLASRNLVGRGYANMELTWENPPPKPKKRSGDDAETAKRREMQWEIDVDSWNPLKIRAYNPTRVLIPPFENPIGIAIKQSWFTNQQLWAMTRDMAEGREGVAIWNDGGKPTEKRLCYETWTDDHHILTISTAEEVFREDNFWGFSTFEHGFSGWGDEFAGEDGSDPMWFAAGLLETQMETLLWQAKIRSGLNAVMMREAFNKLVTKLGKKQIEALIQGSIIYDTDPKDVQYLTHMGTSAHLSEQANWLDSSVERGSIASVLAGIREPGVTTVGQNAQMIYYGGLKFVAPSKALGYLASNTTSKMFKMIALKNEPVKIAGITIKPEDIDDIYRCTVTFEQVDPVLKMELEKWEAQKVTLKLSDWWSFQEVADQKDDTEMLERLVKHEFYFGDPNTMTPYMLDMVEKYADSVGKGDIWRARMGAAPLTPSAPPRPPSANPPGGMPMPESATIQAAESGGIPNA